MRVQSDEGRQCEPRPLCAMPGLLGGLGSSRVRESVYMNVGVVCQGEKGFAAPLRQYMHLQSRLRPCRCGLSYAPRRPDPCAITRSAEGASSQRKKFVYDVRV